MSVSFLTTLVCRAEVVPAYRKSLFSPIKLATNIEPVHTYNTILQKKAVFFLWGGGRRKFRREWFQDFCNHREDRVPQ